MRPGGHPIRIAALLCGIALFLGACSDGDESLDGPSAAPGDSSVEDTPSTSSSTTSSTTTSTSSTTTTTTVAVDPDAKPLIEIPTEWPNAQAEVFGRYLLYWDAIYIAFGGPLPDADYAPLKEIAEVGTHADLEHQAEDLLADGLVLVLPENSITEHILRLTDTRPPEKIEGNEVIIQDCWVDDSELRTVDGQLHEANRRSVLKNVTMKVIDGEWKLWSSGDALPESDGYEECSAYIDRL